MNHIVQVAVIQEHASYFHPVRERRVKPQETHLSHSSITNNFTLEKTVWNNKKDFLVKCEKWPSCRYCYLSIRKANMQARIKATKSVIAFYSSTSVN